MIAPEKINPGDKIRIVAPAGKIKEERVLPAVNWLKGKGYVVEIGEFVFSNHYQFAGTENQRLADLQLALDDPDCKAIFCARGGYGTVQLIDKISFDNFLKYPKWVVGYSDITILHLAIQKLGVETIHGSMPPFYFNQNMQANQNLLSLIELLTSGVKRYDFQTGENLRPTKIQAPIIGGNLSIICSLMGTKYEIDTNHKILFIEEVDEYLYHIERMLLQLKLAGKFDNLAGLIVGDFTNIKDNESPFGKNVREIISDLVQEYKFPVAFGFPAGHGETNLALNFGKNCNLEIGKTSFALSY